MKKRKRKNPRAVVLVRLGGRPTGKVAARTVREEPQEENCRPCPRRWENRSKLPSWRSADSAIVPVAQGTAATALLEAVS